MVFRTWDLNFGAWIFTLAVSKTETWKLLGTWFSGHGWGTRRLHSVRRSRAPTSSIYFSCYHHFSNETLLLEKKDSCIFFLMFWSLYVHFSLSPIKLWFWSFAIAIWIKKKIKLEKNVSISCYLPYYLGGSKMSL
jgi:hypothetical protein